MIPLVKGNLFLQFHSHNWKLNFVDADSSKYIWKKKKKKDSQLLHEKFPSGQAQKRAWHTVDGSLSTCTWHLHGRLRLCLCKQWPQAPRNLLELKERSSRSIGSYPPSFSPNLNSYWWWKVCFSFQCQIRKRFDLMITKRRHIAHFDDEEKLVLKFAVIITTSKPNYSWTSGVNNFNKI